MADRVPFHRPVLEGLSEAMITSRRLLRVSPVLSDVSFVGRHAFAADRWSAGLFATLTALMAALPAAQVSATAVLISRLRSGAALGELVGPVSVVVIAVALSTPLAALAAAIGERVMLRTELRLQSHLAMTISRMTPSQLADPEISADIEGHTNAIVDVVSHVYGSAVSGLGAILSAVGVVITVWFMSPWAAILVLAAAIPVALSGKYVSRAAERMMNLLGPLYQRDRYLRDTLVRQRSVTELASLGTTDRLAEMVIAHQGRVIDARDITVRARVRVQLFIGLSGVILLGAAIVAIIVGKNYGPEAVAGIYGVIAAMTATGVGSVALAELLQFLPQTTAVRGFFAAAPNSRQQAIAPRADELRLDSLSHRYRGRSSHALSDLNLTVRRGEMIALVGVNGAGKTTAIHATLGLIEPTGGTVSVDGRTRADLGEAAWHGQFGLLTQEFGRYEFTVRDAVALGSPQPVGDDQIWAALDAAHAGALVRDMLDELDTQLGEQ